LLFLHNDKSTGHVVAHNIDYLQPLKPASARTIPVAPPIPEAAPVTSATLPETSIAYNID